jgi:hypothetical protein
VDSTLLPLQVWCSPRYGARTASEGSLEAVEPFPGLAGVKSAKEERRLPSQSHRSTYRQDAIHNESHCDKTAQVNSILLLKPLRLAIKQ